MLAWFVLGCCTYNNAGWEDVTFQRSFGKITAEYMLNKMYGAFSRHYIDARNAWSCTQMEPCLKEPIENQVIPQPDWQYIQENRPRHTFDQDTSPWERKLPTFLVCSFESVRPRSQFL